MRLLLTADWHLSENPRDAYRWGAVESVLKVAEEQNAAHLFVLGDMTDFPDHHSATFTNRVVDLLTRAVKVCPITLITGNHDGSDPRVPFFRFVNAIPGLQFHTQPAQITFNQLVIDLIPYGCWQPAQITGDLVFTHNTFNGAKLENGMQLPGLSLPQTGPRIWSGDVHVPQKHGLVTYVGPPSLIRFGDAYQPRVLVLLLDGYDPTPAVRVIPINGPNKRLVELTVHPDGQFEFPSGVLFKGDIVKARVTFAGGIPSLAKLRGDLQGWADSMGVHLHTVIPQIDNRRTPLPATPVSRDDRDLVRQYASVRHLDEPTVKAGLAVIDQEEAT